MGSQQDDIKDRSDHNEYDPEDKDSGKIRKDIASTRADMDATLNAIGERLHPRNMIDDVVDLFRGQSATFVSAGEKLLGKVKKHPLPTALISAGVVWLLVENGKRGKRKQQQTGEEPPAVAAPPPLSAGDLSTGGPAGPDPHGRPRSARTRPLGSEEDYTSEDEMRDKEFDSESSLGESNGGRAARAGRRVRSAAAGIKDSASSAVGRMRDAGRSVRETASQAARPVASRTSSAVNRARAWSEDVSDRVKDRASRGYDKAANTAAEHPLAVGLGAVATGVLIGLLIPRTRREDELMGAESDAFRSEVSDAGREVFARGKRAAGAAVQATERSAHEEGIAPHELEDKVKEVAHAAREAAEKEIHHEQGWGESQQGEPHEGA